jgi:hypothetical protein
MGLFTREGDPKVQRVSCPTEHLPRNTYHGDNHPTKPTSGFVGTPGTETRRKSGVETWHCHVSLPGQPKYHTSEGAGATLVFCKKPVREECAKTVHCQ